MTASWIETANREPTLIERMRALLRADDGISFAELDQLDGFRGDQALLTGEDRGDLVLWPSVSAQAISDLATLIAGGECHIGAASLFTYVCDGRLPSLPIGRKGRRIYKRPHWLPAMLLRGTPRSEPSPSRPAPRRKQRKPAPHKRWLVPGKLRARR